MKTTMMATESYLYTATTDAESERQLARSLGYPKSWHVVRLVPHPSLIEEEPETDDAGGATASAIPSNNDELTGGETGQAIVQSEEDNKGLDKDRAAEKVKSGPGKGTYMDIIYTGDPSAGVDVYYNHSAALAAALQWNEETSTGYDNKGGQMLPRVAKFKKGSWVEVFYPDENKWYKAQVEKVKHYANDVR